MRRSQEARGHRLILLITLLLLLLLLLLLVLLRLLMQHLLKQHLPVPPLAPLRLSSLLAT